MVVLRFAVGRGLGDRRSRAACLDENMETFFPIGAGGQALEQIERAKTICRRCPVADACLAWALGTGQTERSGAASPVTSAGPFAGPGYPPLKEMRR